MFDLRPFQPGKRDRLKHASLSVATTGSSSISAPGTGLALIPVYWWAISSAVASIAVINGTTASSGSVLISAKTTTGVMIQAAFWDDTILPNKALSLESTLNGGGTLDFHVWYTVRRVGAGDGGTTSH